MIYLDSAATSLRKPETVYRAVARALRICGNPGRGGHAAAANADRCLYRCREAAGRLFGCEPQQVVLTNNCTHGLNIAIHSLVKPGSSVVVSGFEHNAVLRPLYARKANITVAGRKLFDWADTLKDFRKAIQTADCAVFSCASNVFGYQLPVTEMAAMCRQRGIPFILDAAQAAGAMPLSLEALGADFIAMPGHKGLLGPMGTGLLLCRNGGEPLLHGGTGGASKSKTMPEDLPERLEAGTANVPGFAGLTAGLHFLARTGVEAIGAEEARQAALCAEGLRELGYTVFSGPHQGGTLSFLPKMDCEEAAELLAEQGIALRAGLHCAPLAHESAGTLDSGTVRVSFGWGAGDRERLAFLGAAAKSKTS